MNGSTVYARPSVHTTRPPRSTTRDRELDSILTSSQSHGDVLDTGPPTGFEPLLLLTPISLPAQVVVMIYALVLALLGLPRPSLAAVSTFLSLLVGLFISFLMPLSLILYKHSKVERSELPEDLVDEVAFIYKLACLWVCIGPWLILLHSFFWLLMWTA